jgi:hypothetical protein
MPRTKLNKNGLTKRNRRNSMDEKKEEFIREVEIEGKYSGLVFFSIYIFFLFLVY